MGINLLLLQIKGQGCRNFDNILYLFFFFFCFIFLKSSFEVVNVLLVLLLDRQMSVGITLLPLWTKGQGHIKRNFVTFVLRFFFKICVKFFCFALLIF